MRKKLPAFLASMIIVLSLSSCTSTYSTTGAISFYDDSTLLGKLEGSSGTLISENATDYALLEQYQTKADHEFANWYLSADFSRTIDISYYPYKDIDVYAKFLNDVTITLDAGTGTFAAGAITTYSGVESNEIKDEFAVPSKTNATFLGWFLTAAAEDTDEFTSNFFPSEDITLYAKYSDWPTLSFETNVAGYEIDSIQIEPNTAVPDDLIDVTKLDKGDSYKFDGWYTEDTFENQFSFEYMPEVDTTIYAKFLEKQTINFITNVPGYDIPDYVGFPGEAISAPVIDEASMKIDGKYFDGWYETIDFSGDKFAFSEMPENDVTLYGYWVDDPVITLYDTDDVTVIAEINTYEPGSFVDLTAFNPDHGQDDFLNWVTKTTETVGGVETTTETVIFGPENYMIPDQNTDLFVRYRTNYLLTIDFVDTAGVELAAIDNYEEIYGSYLIEDPTAELTTYLTTASATTYKPIRYLNSLDAEISFPYAISSAETVKAVLAQEVTITLETYVDAVTPSIPIGTLTGLQTEMVVDTEVVTIDNVSGNYFVYGIDTNMNATDYNWAFAYDKSVGDEPQFQLSNAYPDSDITYVLVFIAAE